MSYEYKLAFKNPSDLKIFFKSLTLTNEFVKMENGNIWLKDIVFDSKVMHDVRIIPNGIDSLWIEVNFSSVRLLELMDKHLKDMNFQFFADGDDDDPVELSEVFYS